MSDKVLYINLGEVEYEKCTAIQRSYFDPLVEAKRQGEKVWDGKGPRPGQGDHPRVVLFCSHPHVYTLGKSGKPGNMLVDEAFLKNIGAAFYRTDRGGDITYHGPGQIVGYPILDLELTGQGLREYIEGMEQSVMDVMQEYGLKTRRMEGATGVWMAEGPARKVCAIGVRSSRYVTMHGFALNVCTDNRFFGYINPCGFTDRSATSMEAELGFKPDMEEVRQKLLARLEKNMNIKIIQNDHAYRKEMGCQTSERSGPDGRLG